MGSNPPSSPLAPTGTDPRFQKTMNATISSSPYNAALLACSVIFSTVTFTLVAMRIYVRARLLKVFFVEDWLMAFAGLMAVIDFVGLMLLTVRGNVEMTMGRPGSRDEGKFLDYYTIMMLTSCGVAIQNTLARASMLYTFKRFASVDGRVLRATLMAFVVAMVIALLFTLWLDIFPCWPPKLKPWTQTVARMGSFESKCGPQVMFTAWFAGSIVNCIMDFIIFFLPYLLFRRVRVRRSERNGLYALFAFGGVVFILSVVRLTRLRNVAFVMSRTTPADVNVSWIASVAECNCIMIAACIPTLKPLYRKITGSVSSNGSKPGTGSKRTGRQIATQAPTRGREVDIELKGSSTWRDERKNVGRSMRSSRGDDVKDGLSMDILDEEANPFQDPDGGFRSFYDDNNERAPTGIAGDNARIDDPRSRTSEPTPIERSPADTAAGHRYHDSRSDTAGKR